MIASDREVLLSLIASLTLCDHMGDASNDALLQKNYGVKTLYGTTFEEE